MNGIYQNLQHRLLAPGTSILFGHGTESVSITLDDKAAMVYTDFSYTRPFTIGPTATISQINDRMIACGVRLLFVTEAAGVLKGLVTYTDLFGEKPVRYIQEHGGTRDEILAQDIMTPRAQLETLLKADVQKASVGDIIETIEAADRQHMLVSDNDENNSQVVTGLFSSTHIENLLGIKIELSNRAHSFADLEKALT
jgi:CBS domain-containing protein